jgi:hypothetical protein
MLAIIWSLQEWQHFVKGAEHQFKIWMDHKNLEYFMSAKQLTGRPGGHSTSPALISSITGMANLWANPTCSPKEQTMGLAQTITPISHC